MFKAGRSARAEGRQGLNHSPLTTGRKFGARRSERDPFPKPFSSPKQHVQKVSMLVDGMLHF